MSLWPRTIETEERSGSLDDVLRLSATDKGIVIRLDNQFGWTEVTILHEAVDEFIEKIKTTRDASTLMRSVKGETK